MAYNATRQPSFLPSGNLPTDQEELDPISLLNFNALSISTPPPPPLSTERERYIFFHHIGSQLSQIHFRCNESQVSSSTNGYPSYLDFLNDVRPVIGFLWSSIVPTHNEGNNKSILTLAQYNDLPQAPVFKQVEYLITIASDILDFSYTMGIRDEDTIEELFSILGSLDHIFARLLYGFIPGGKRLGVIEERRVKSIAERSKLGFVEVFKWSGILDESKHVDGTYEIIEAALSKLYGTVLSSAYY